MTDHDRREALRLLAGAGAASVAGCSPPPVARGRTRGDANADDPPETPTSVVPEPAPDLGRDAVQRVSALGSRWATSDPFLFCAHHHDAYPQGNLSLGPAASLAGREMGRDFAGKDGWSMYHGEVVPGFPRHPHRGFETVSVVRTGLLDHSDSLGARARYGGGDVQWLTAGRGMNHAEMFPLVEQSRPNPLELFQIWLNLPAVDKMVDPYFTMFWSDTIPQHESVDDAGRATSVTVVAGNFADAFAPRPPPNSWASRPEADVAIWTLKMQSGARFRLPAAQPGTSRSLYFFEGSGLRVGGQAIADYHRIELQAGREVVLEAGSTSAQLLLLQGRPIGEPVSRHGPFVMNTREEIQQAYADYHRTAFGGWPWSGADPVHGANETRFAQYVDGRLDRPA